MATLRRLIGFIVLGLVIAAAGAMATGRLAHVTTEGVSMEPTYSRGDLVVIGRQESYAIGQIVAYREPGDDTLVLHRIVDGDEGGFTLRGDNNQSIDPHHPSGDEILGRAVLHVPRVGGVLTSPLARATFLFLALAIPGVMTMRPTRRSHDSSTTVRSPRRARRLVAMSMVALDVALVAAFALVQLSSTDDRGSSGADSPETIQTAALSYHADVERSDTYPDGEVSTGEAVFRRLANRVDVRFHHTTDADGTVSGTARMALELSTASGWVSTRELIGSTDLRSGAVDMEATLDLAEIEALAERVAEATGVPAGTIDLLLTVTGEAGADPGAREPFTIDLPLQLSPTSLVTTADTTTSPEGPVVASTVPLDEAAPDVDEDRSLRDLRTPLLAAALLASAGTVVVWPTDPDEDAVTTTTAIGVELPDVARIQLADQQAIHAIASAVGRPVIATEEWEGVLTPDALYWHGRTIPPDALGEPGDPLVRARATPVT